MSAIWDQKSEVEEFKSKITFAFKWKYSHKILQLTKYLELD